jgi:hypothetical protein
MADIEPLPPIQGLGLVKAGNGAMTVTTAAKNIPIRRSN